MQSFYRMFPPFQQCPVIITGEVSRLFLQGRGWSTAYNRTGGQASLNASHVPKAGTFQVNLAEPVCCWGDRHAQVWISWRLPPVLPLPLLLP